MRDYRMYHDPNERVAVCFYRLDGSTGRKGPWVWEVKRKFIRDLTRKMGVRGHRLVFIVRLKRRKS